jgi:Fic family protein
MSKRSPTTSNRAGHYSKQASDYFAFIPAPLPPSPQIHFDKELLSLLTKADRALGRLDGASSILPHPDLFVAMYVRQEAVYSSQIEGTQSTLEDVLEFEAGASSSDTPKDVGEVVNYVKAMNHGLYRLKELPLSLRLVKEIHKILMHQTRGGHKEPGEFRRSQNWIGPAGCTLTNATFVPPPLPEMKEALHNLEKFWHDSHTLPDLIHCGIAHVQFETIHPFLDGNGRIGRLLITFLLCERKILSQPLLYLSHFFKLHREDYYQNLMKVRRDGDWEGWLKFFLQGVYEVSEEATLTARAILDLQENHRRIIRSEISGATNGMVLLDFLFRNPIITIKMTAEHLDCAYVTASTLIEHFVRLGFLKELTGTKRNRKFRYEPYLELFQ